MPPLRCEKAGCKCDPKDYKGEVLACPAQNRFIDVKPLSKPPVTPADAELSKLSKLPDKGYSVCCVMKEHKYGQYRIDMTFGVSKPAKPASSAESKAPPPTNSAAPAQPPSSPTESIVIGPDGKPVHDDNGAEVALYAVVGGALALIGGAALVAVGSRGITAVRNSIDRAAFKPLGPMPPPPSQSFENAKRLVAINLIDVQLQSALKDWYVYEDPNKLKTIIDDRFQLIKFETASERVKVANIIYAGGDLGSLGLESVKVDTGGIPKIKVRPQGSTEEADWIEIVINPNAPELLNEAQIKQLEKGLQDFRDLIIRMGVETEKAEIWTRVAYRLNSTMTNKERQERDRLYPKKPGETGGFSEAWLRNIGVGDASIDPERSDPLPDLTKTMVFAAAPLGPRTPAEELIEKINQDHRLDTEEKQRYVELVEKYKNDARLEPIIIEAANKPVGASVNFFREEIARTRGPRAVPDHSKYDPKRWEPRGRFARLFLGR